MHKHKDRTASPSWLEADRRHAWHPYTQHGLDEALLPVASAKGARLKLSDGRELIDAISSWWSILHGHAEPALLEAMSTQAATLDHVLYAGCSHEPAARLAEELVQTAARLADDRRKLERVFYSDNGSTAIEVALKAAYQFHLRRGEGQRQVFLALEGAYHGDTFGAMAVGDPVPFFQEFDPLLFDVVRVPIDAEALRASAAELGNRLCAIILEPGIQGAAGMRAVPAEVVRAAREACDREGGLLIADEVMTGFGRTGRLFACELSGVCPDFLALAKGLTGGIMPLSATLMSEEVFAAFHDSDRSRSFFHGHTFTAHPIGCAVARASLKLVQERDTPKLLDRVGQQIETAVRAALSEHTELPALTVRRVGGMVAVEAPDQDDHGYLAPIGEMLRAACRACPDVLLRPLGPVLYALPPACTRPDEAATIGRSIVDTYALAWQRATPSAHPSTHAISRR